LFKIGLHVFGLKNGHFWKEIGPKLFKIGLHVFGLKHGHFWKEIGQKLAQNCSKLGSFFALKKWPFLERNWPKIDPKLFKIGLHVFGLKNGHFWKEIGRKLSQSCSKSASMFLA